MTFQRLTAALAFSLLIASPALAANNGKNHSTKAQAITLNPDDLKWGNAPPTLPKGAQMAAMSGDPTKKGLFAFRLKLPAGYKVAPHWHTNDEQLTIISGTFVLHMGDTMDAPATTIHAGGFHFLPGKMHHAAVANEETIVQVSGMGPFDIHYLNPLDDPSKQGKTER